MGKHLISIWFIIGSLLTVYGVLILGQGLYELATGISSSVVISQLHIDIWWGAGMLLLGLIYLIRYWPRRGTDVNE
jgi:hypothetical protein